MDLYLSFFKTKILKGPNQNFIPGLCLGKWLKGCITLTALQKVMWMNSDGSNPLLLKGKVGERAMWLPQSHQFHYNYFNFTISPNTL